MSQFFAFLFEERKKTFIYTILPFTIIIYNTVYYTKLLNIAKILAFPYIPFPASPI